MCATVVINLRILTIKIVLVSTVVSALSGMAISSKPPAVGSYAFRHSSRSFSLRQSSTDSIGSDSDLVSPTADGALPALQRGISCESVCSDTSVILGDLDPVNITGHLCVGLEYDRYRQNNNFLLFFK